MWNPCKIFANFSTYDFDCYKKRIDEELIQDSLTEDVDDFGGASFIIAKLQEWLRNTYQIKAERNTEKYARWITIRNTCSLLLDGWCLRLRDIHIKPSVIIRFSMLLLFLNC